MDFLLKEDGDQLLQENGEAILVTEAAASEQRFWWPLE